MVYNPIEQQGAACALGMAAARGEIELSAIVHGDYPGTQLPENVLPGLGSAGYWNARKNQSWGKTWHRHKIIEFIFVETGKLGITGNDEVAHVLQSNQMVISRPWHMFKNGSPHIEAGRVAWVDIDVQAAWPNQAWKWPSWVVLTAEDLAQIESFLRYSDVTIFNTDVNIRKNYIQIEKLIEKTDQRNTISQIIIAINDLLLNILQMLQNETVSLDKTQSDSQHVVELFLDGLAKSILEMKKPWTVKKMASECGLGETLFTACCRSYTNKTPGDYLRTLKLNKARQLLSDSPELSITEIAEICGFGTQTYFTTSFTGEFGSSPREFRNQGENACKNRNI